MSKKTQELILEIFEANNGQAPLVKNESRDSPIDAIRSEKSYRNATSPSQGEGWCEGKEQGQLNGVVVGQLKVINDQGQPLVVFSGNPFLAPIQARSVVRLEEADLERDVILAFEQGNSRKPIILGVLQSSEERPQEIHPGEKSTFSHTVNVELDGERVTLSAQKEIVLRCGKASITLTQAGKILIRGAYVSSRSSGPNLIKGGSVQLN
ncbi:MAG: DUF6484 domain-containing protein [Nitrospirales bacterium]